ncbi:hypothetical protein [Natronomonas sp. EA1]|uniref:hypothetical protein n=1 Tax=Natronomonas sp. EA1 TaxID=3421655 RepID=UPI003EBC5FD8
MQGNSKLFALVASALMVVSVFGVGAVGATAAANGELDVGVSQGEDVTVSVTSNGTAVEGANVSVTTSGNYSGTGDYTTGAAGTVSLPSPEENVTISVTASYENMTASTTADLVAGGNATNETNETNETSEFEYDGTGPFGEDVAAFVQYAQSYSNESNYTVGELVSQFVTTNNPGQSQKATHPVFGGDDDGNETDENETEVDDDRRGPPADKGPNKDKKDKPKGKPAHAGGDDDEAEDEDEDDEEEDSGRPDHAGNGNGPKN